MVDTKCERVIPWVGETPPLCMNGSDKGKSIVKNDRTNTTLQPSYTGRIAPKFANQSNLGEAASCSSGYRTRWTGEGLQGLIQGLITEIFIAITEEEVTTA